MRPKSILTATLAALAVLLAACGGERGVEANRPADAANGTRATPQDAPPERVVSLSPTATEVLFAIGAGDQVVAVDNQSNFPAGAPITDLSGWQPNVEAIAAHRPELVIASGAPDDLAPALAAIGVELIDHPAPADLEEAYRQIAELGIATGREDAAAELVANMRAQIDELVARAPERAEPLTYYHELDETLYSVTSRTFIGQIYALAGLRSIADAADPEGAMGGYPQLSVELLVEADPDFVFLANTKCCGQTPETFAARPGLGGLSAVREGRVIGLDDDIASRWGPRLVEFLRTIVEVTAGARVG